MTLHKWQRIKENVIFEHPRLTLLEDTVQVSAGHRTTYLHFKHTHDAASIIIVDKDNRILLQQEYSYPPDTIMWQLPGGGVGLNEPIKAGAARELAEECGLTGTIKVIGSYFIDNRRSSAKMHICLATQLHEITKQAGDPEEFVEHQWFTPQAIDQLIAQGKIVNAHLLACWLIYKSYIAKQPSA